MIPTEKHLSCLGTAEGAPDSGRSSDRTVGERDESDKGGHFKQETGIDFKSLSDSETEIAYRSEVMVGGRLATFGERIMRAKAKELGKEFAAAVKNKLEQSAA